MSEAAAAAAGLAGRPDLPQAAQTPARHDQYERIADSAVTAVVAEGG
jgi:hypothetical protein